jgi:6-phosphofructokinase 1
VRYGSTVVGFEDGWRGLLENRRVQLVNDDRNDRLLAKGGTMLGTARVNPDKLRAGLEQIKQNLDDNGIDCLIPIGGEGTLTAGGSPTRVSPWSACPRRSTTTSTRPTSRSATTPR